MHQGTQQPFHILRSCGISHSSNMINHSHVQIFRPNTNIFANEETSHSENQVYQGSLRHPSLRAGGKTWRTNERMHCNEGLIGIALHPLRLWRKQISLCIGLACPGLCTKKNGRRLHISKHDPTPRFFLNCQPQSPLPFSWVCSAREAAAKVAKRLTYRERQESGHRGVAFPSRVLCYPP